VALKATIALALTGLLFSGSVILFLKTRTVPLLLQVIGAGCFLVVALAHICEGLGLLPWMGWSQPNSIGHYLDLVSAIAGLTMFPIGCLWHALTK
jgi:hypothetical protein